MIRPKGAAAAVLLAAALAAPACGGGAASDTVVGEASSLFPHESLSDWKSYADHVVVFAVVDEQEIPLQAEEQQRGEGLVGRRVTVRIDEIVWSSPDAPELPDQVTTAAPGWVLQDGERQKFGVRGAPRPEVGEDYVAPFVFYDDHEPPEWGPLNGASQLPLVDGRVAADTTDDGANPVRDLLAGKTPEDVGAAVEREPADPMAAKYRHLRPMKRIKAVQRHSD